jgi:lipid-A-disaccharide synthase
VLLLPLRFFDYQLERDDLRRELEADLCRRPEIVATPELAAPPARALRVFLSCAEASGELHALNLARAVGERLAAMNAPAPDLVGLGSERLRAAGLRAVGDPVQRAAMGFGGMLRSLPYYVRLIADCARVLGDEAPDVCVLIDSPALHVPLGHIARRCGIPVVHFATPQYWAWAPWRARGYRSAVSRALTILPFEPSWFRRRGIDCAHVGHPLQDDLAGVAPAQAPAHSRVLVLLPGSRASVVDRNLPWMLAACERLRERAPDLEVLVAQGNPGLVERCQMHVDSHPGQVPARVEGDLHACLSRARAALSVSGTVLLDILHHRLPVVVIYRLAGRHEDWMRKHLLTVPHFASINLLAGRRVVPEFAFAGSGPTEAIDAETWALFDDEERRRDCRDGLDLAAQRLGPAGACARAADQCLLLALGPGAPPVDQPMNPAMKTGRA